MAMGSGVLSRRALGHNAIRLSSEKSKPARGQAIVEYSLFIAIVTAAIMGIQLYSKRAIQAGIKNAADQLSPCAQDNPMCDGIVDTNGEFTQEMGVRNETGDKKFQLTGRGQVLSSESAASARSDPADNFTHRLEAAGGQVTITRRSRLESHGAMGGGQISRQEVVIDDTNPL